MRQSLLILLVLCANHSLTVCAKLSEASGQLTVTSDGRMSGLRQMPSDVSHPGLSFERRAYTDHEAIEWQVRLQ